MLCRHAVETKPPDPEQQGAHRLELPRVLREIANLSVYIPADARAHHDAGDERGRPAQAVDGERARKVNDPAPRHQLVRVLQEGGQEPTAAPHPVGSQGEDEGGDGEGVGAVHSKGGALGHGARDDGGGGGAEAPGEEPLGPVRGQVRGCARGRPPEVVPRQGKLVLAHETRAVSALLSVLIIAKCNSVSNKPPHEGSNTSIKCIFQQNSLNSLFLNASHF
mmetsp:Transcript_5020/g.7620  ORF Transcript_5020/g.7620 Transcript_5020/m.7620 type:complete len:221 (-) Transcript_5020:201-863(-)